MSIVGAGPSWVRLVVLRTGCGLGADRERQELVSRPPIGSLLPTPLVVLLDRRAREGPSASPSSSTAADGSSAADRQDTAVGRAPPREGRAAPRRHRVVR